MKSAVQKHQQKEAAKYKCPLLGLSLDSEKRQESVELTTAENNIEDHSSSIYVDKGNYNKYIVPENSNKIVQVGIGEN